MNRKVKGIKVFIDVCYVIALGIIAAPLLWISQYNVPSADDWSYGSVSYKTIQQGGSFLKLLLAIVNNVINFYSKWEGRFINSFLAALQPGIWGEHCYGIVGWMMIVGLVLGEMILIRMFFCGVQKENANWIPVIVPSLIMQILYTPNTVESFYWYTGAVNYTFIFSLSMIFFALFWGIGRGYFKDKKRIIAGICASVLAIMIGGDNYSTSLSTVVAVLAFYLWVLFFSEKEREKGRYNWNKLKDVWEKTWYLTILVVGSLAVCLLSPGNQARLNGNFGGEVSHSAIWAISHSLIRTFTNIYSWMNARVIIMLLLTVPFIWKRVKTAKIKFYAPGMFTIISFGVYASQITANLYVDGTTGGGRAAAILYYFFHVWLLVNEFWWIGWLVQKAGERIQKAEQLIDKYLIVYCAVCGVALVGLILTRDKMELSSYRAYRDCRQGWAKQYASEWDERFDILHDSNISEVVFKPLTVYPETILYTDLQDENGYLWVNSACANYYGKKSVSVNEN